MAEVKKIAARQSYGEALKELGAAHVALIANGLLAAEALEAVKLLAEQGISARVIDMAAIKPLERSWC